MGPSSGRPRCSDRATDARGLEERSDNGLSGRDFDGRCARSTACPGAAAPSVSLCSRRIAKTRPLVAAATFRNVPFRD
jgi:hypothetical protein